MAKTFIARFRVSSEQYSKIQTNAYEKGFKTVAAYLRDLCFIQESSLNKILFKLHSLECKIKEMQEASQNGRTKS